MSSLFLTNDTYFFFLASSIVRLFNALAAVVNLLSLCRDMAKRNHSCSVNL